MKYLRCVCFYVELPQLPLDILVFMLEKQKTHFSNLCVKNGLFWLLISEFVSFWLRLVSDNNEPI